MVLKDFESMCQNTTTIHKNNLSKEENIALKELSNVGALNRVDLLEKSKKKIFRGITKRIDESRTSDKSPLFVITYNNAAQDITSILNRHWSIILRDPIIGSKLPSRIPVVFKKARNLKTLLAPSRLKQNIDHSIRVISKNVAPGGHVSPETEQVSSPGSASSTHLEEHDEEDYDDDDDDDDATAIDTQIEASDHEDVPIETVLPPNRPANTTYDAIVASEGKIVEAENRRHSDLMTVLERMIALQEETVSQLAHLHRVFIEVPKQLQKINTSFEALVVQQTQANYLRMTNVPQFNLNSSQAGSVHAGQFSPHASDLHSPGPNVTGQVADIAVQVPDDILPLPSVQNQQLTPTKEPTKTKHKQLLLTSFWSKTTKDTHETDQPSLVQCLPTCSHVSVGTSPVGESLATSPVGESLPKSPVGESLAKSPVEFFLQVCGTAMRTSFAPSFANLPYDDDDDNLCVATGREPYPQMKAAKVTSFQSTGPHNLGVSDQEFRVVPARRKPGINSYIKAQASSSPLQRYT
ncbi:uncharacterized protein LOC142492388 [Ascaphus truei]|uniref:uncharacterized protein LOC142492388 n=1 Tax=Ascaphus truei TaxID=8439 RepID=UPI003F5A7C39